MNNILLKCENISKSFNDNNSNIKLLNNISLKIFYKDTISIIGNSGSGKSTFLHILAGLDIPDSGNIFFKNKNINNFSSSDKYKFRNKELGFIYQFHHLLSDFSVLENVAMPLFIRKIPVNEAKKKAYNILCDIGLEKYCNNMTDCLSGGEKQKISIARALINNPSLILADEPTGNLDYINTNIIFNLLLELNKKKNTTLIIITHDIRLAKKLNKCFELKKGRLEKLKY